jgi:antibiotic biosynthesis monooxygenase (ABM) superfamily enzyme
MVTLSGTDFTAASSVSINGVSAIVVNKSTSALTAMVMPGASTSGSVSYTTATGTTTAIPGTYTVTPTGVPATQQGTKLGATDAIGYAQQGYSVAVSADGNTAVVGGVSDNVSVGASWVYTRSGGIWAQQGKLVASDAVGAAQQGSSVAVSADGNTAVVGGYKDNGSIGAAWVYTRSGTTWTQQGSKLVGTGAVGPAYQGSSVALSADGNTAVVGGYNDNAAAGAAWVYTLSGGTWMQQGSKLVGSGAVGAAYQGWSVAVNADGNTAVVGGLVDNSSAGATWVYTRSGGTWTQQGSKLVGTGAAGSFSLQGTSVALSADGNTAVVGGYYDNNGVGAAWVYTRSGTTWTQQGSKLVGNDATINAWQGYSAALSADGSTAMVGGYQDNSSVGAAWTYIP